MADHDVVNVNLRNGSVVLEVGAAGNEPQSVELTPVKAREVGQMLLGAAKESERK
jgi:hypothetical protein